MPQRLSTLSSSSYATLVREVRGAIATGKERALQAVEAEKVRTSWQIGKLIHTHILRNQKRAGYGQKVLHRLSRDIHISESSLYYMLEFARENPIFRSIGKLPWTHHQKLLGINDPAKRDLLVRRAAKGKWTVEKLRSEIKKSKLLTGETVKKQHSEKELLVPIKGALDTYLITDEKDKTLSGEPVIDLGFSSYLELPEQYRGKFKAGDVVSVEKSDASYTLKPSELTKKDLFTYRTKLVDVTDADTFWFLIKLGFGVTTKQQLRLRGLDAPEIISREGLRAKAFVKRVLKNASEITITSTKSDKYDRYLADVWFRTKAGVHHLNNLLLQKGLAQRMI